MRKYSWIFFILLSGLKVNAQSVFEIIQKSPQHQYFANAIQAARMDSFLTATNGITLFAPSDEAFLTLSPREKDQLWKDPKGKLRQFIKMHCIDAAIPSTKMGAKDTIQAIHGNALFLTMVENMHKVNNAWITLTDLKATNGYVHMIDTFLAYPKPSIWEIIQSSENHKTLSYIIEVGGYEDIFKMSSNTAVFAPTDAAFEAIPTHMIRSMLNDPQGDLLHILSYHILGMEAFADTLSDFKVAATLHGAEVDVQVNAFGQIKINQANIITADIEASNGVVHVIDAVLFPEKWGENDFFEVGQVNIFPTAASEFVTIELKNFENEAQIILLDGWGNVVQLFDGVRDTMQLSVVNLPVGNYVLHITDKKRHFVQRFKRS